MRGLPIFATLALFAVSPCMAQAVLHDGDRDTVHQEYHPDQQRNVTHHDEHEAYGHAVEGDTFHHDSRADQQHHVTSPHNEAYGYDAKGDHRDAARERADAQHRAAIAEHQDHPADQNGRSVFIDR